MISLALRTTVAATLAALWLAAASAGASEAVPGPLTGSETLAASVPEEGLCIESITSPAGDSIEPPSGLGCPSKAARDASNDLETVYWPGRWEVSGVRPLLRSARTNPWIGVSFDARWTGPMPSMLRVCSYEIRDASGEPLLWGQTTVHSRDRLAEDVTVGSRRHTWDPQGRPASAEVDCDEP